MGLVGVMRVMGVMRPVGVMRAVVVVACVATLGHAETRPHYGGIVEGSLVGAPVVLDPVAAASHADLTVVGLVFDTLYTVGADGTVTPHLALGPPVVDPVRGITHIAIRHGVVFHDGSPLVASDVADSLERVRTRLGWLLAPVTSIRASGDGVDLVLRAPAAELSALLALPQASITKHGQAPAAGRPIGTGPFAVDSLARRKLVLRAFDEHFAGRPYLDRLELGWFDTPDGEARRFETGGAQLSARGVGAFAGAQPKYPALAVESPTALLLFVGFGRQHAQVTGERSFRRALDLALDRGALATITTGEHTLPTRVPLPVEAGAVMLDATGRAGDAGAGRAVLADAGKQVAALAAGSLQGVKLAIIIDETRPDDRELALRVSRGLDKLAIGSTIEAVAADKLRDRVAQGTCDLWIGQLAAPVGFAVAWWGMAFAAGNDGWVQARLAAGALDPAEVAKQFADQLPIVPLMFRSLLIWHRTDVHGLGFDAIGRPGLADLYWWKGKP